ncbi:trimeric intracellular cation channel family protein [Blastococcus sp. SYSU DS0669]
MATTALLVLDLVGTFAFALNGALTALRTTRLDIVGVVTLGMITALGGGTIRDVFLDSLPPATFLDWRYLAVAAGGGLIAFVAGPYLERLNGAINVLDAAGLSLFAVTGALKALDLGFGPAQAVIVGAITGVGGGTLRDVLIRQVPSVLTSGLYAVPALVGATAVVVAELLGTRGPVASVCAAALCFTIRMVGVHFDVHAPFPPVRRPRPREGPASRGRLRRAPGRRRSRS